MDFPADHRKSTKLKGGGVKITRSIRHMGSSYVSCNPLVAILDNIYKWFLHILILVINLSCSARKSV